MRLNLDMRAWYDSVPRTPPADPQKPPTTIWDPGALLCAEVDGRRVFGKVVSVDPHVDYVLVRSYNFSAVEPVQATWAGTHDAFQRMWSFAHHDGAA